MHISSPLATSVLFCSVETEWKRREIFAGENLMAKLYVCLLCACFYPLEFFSLIWNELKKFRSHWVCMTLRKRNWNEVIIANLKIFSQRTVTMKFRVPSNTVNMSLAQGDTYPMTTPWNANLSRIVGFNMIYYPDFFSNFSGLVENRLYTLQLRKEMKTSQTAAWAQGTENSSF